VEARGLAPGDPTGAAATGLAAFRRSRRATCTAGLRSSACDHIAPGLDRAAGASASWHTASCDLSAGHDAAASLRAAGLDCASGVNHTTCSAGFCHTAGSGIATGARCAANYRGAASSCTAATCSLPAGAVVAPPPPVLPPIGVVVPPVAVVAPPVAVVAPQLPWLRRRPRSCRRSLRRQSQWLPLRLWHRRSPSSRRAVAPPVGVPPVAPYFVGA